MGKVSTEMGKLSFAKFAAAAGGVGLVLSAGAGIASASPDDIINSPCNYGQVMNALRAQDPGAYNQFNASPVAQSYLRQFIAADPGRRAQMAAQLQAMPGASQYFGLVESVAGVCQNYPG